MITFEKVNLNHAYNFFNDIKNIDPYLLSIDQKCIKNKNAVIYKIKYITMQSINNSNIDREIPLCLSFRDVDSYIIKEKRIFALTENNKEALDAFKKLWSEIKKQIKAINSGESIKYKDDFMKIRLDSYDDLSLNKILCFSVLNILCESVFQIENEYYPQIHINECEYECEY